MTFEELDEQIETLEARLDRFRKAILLSRAAVYLGGGVLLIVVTIAQAYRTPTIVFGAFSLLLAGTVWFGATTSSRAEAEAALAAAQTAKARLFDEIAARNGWVEPTPTVH